MAGLKDSGHQQKTRELTREGLKFYESAFQRLGLEFVPSVANFILVKVGDGDRVFAEMMKRGVIVRAMRGYKLPEWVRISVGTAEQNRKCVEVLEAVLPAKPEF